MATSVRSATTHTSESTIIYSEDDDRLYDREQLEQQSNDSAESVIVNPQYAETEVGFQMNIVQQELK